MIDSESYLEVVNNVNRFEEYLFKLTWAKMFFLLSGAQIFQYILVFLFFPFYHTIDIILLTHVVIGNILSILIFSYVMYSFFTIKTTKLEQGNIISLRELGLLIPLFLLWLSSPFLLAGTIYILFPELSMNIFMMLLGSKFRVALSLFITYLILRFQYKELKMNEFVISGCIFIVLDILDKFIDYALFSPDPFLFLRFLVKYKTLVNFEVIFYSFGYFLCGILILYRAKKQLIGDI
ncbi:MAG: hypothetical protein ACXAC7_08660 [Candidatus Hodarchaeales archaeon]|jgi:hypothetical protein